MNELMKIWVNMLYSHCSVSQWVQHILVAKQKGNLDRHEKQDFAFCQSHGSLKGVTCHLTIIKLNILPLCSIQWKTTGYFY